MTELEVGLGERSYPILIENGLLARVGEDLKIRTVGNKYAVVADECVAALYGKDLLVNMKAAGLSAQLFTFPRGEENKTIEVFADLLSRLARKGYDRKDCIVGFGGGVAGDLAGFVAASYMRGISFVQIPTSLLAQVDSSVGGKTGLDIPEGKNLVGAFYQPKAVYIDTGILKSLPREEISGGLAEVIKYGVIRDKDFFNYLEEKREEILALEPAAINRIVYTCCKIKAEVVAEDEREGGVRRILNYGHTIGHAVEGASDFTIIHGLAVAIGMVAAAKIAVHLKLLAEHECERIISILKAYQMPVDIPQHLDRKRIRQYILTDKKSVSGNVFYVLPTCIGQTQITSEVPPEVVDLVLA